MKQQDIRINGIYFTLVSEEEVAVVVTRVVPPDGNWNKKTRYAVKRADNGQHLPKYRTAAALRAEVTALPMEKSAGLTTFERLNLSDAWHTAKRKVAPPSAKPMPHYDALVAKAGEIGWPLRFQTDLTEHDRNLLSKHPSDRPFSWILREGGTGLYYPGIIDRAGHRASDRARAEADTFGTEGCKFFIWDGRALIEYETAEKADARMLEIEEELGVRWGRAQ